MRRPILASAAALLLLAGCARQPAAELVEAPPPPLPSKDAYWVPDSVSRGRQEYAPDYGRFPPLMTQRTGYPTEEQAQLALACAATIKVRLSVNQDETRAGV